MCGGGSSAPSQQQLAIQQEQVTEQAQASAAQLAEQQAEFQQQQQLAQQQLSDQQAQEAAQAAAAAQQAQLAQEWQTGQATAETTATNDINNAFAQFTPSYYQNYTQAYVNNYEPQIQQQYGQASNQMVYGLARSGNLDSQTAANQTGDLAQQLATENEDINNQAVAATTTLENNVNAAKSNLTQQATSDATLGSPITPASQDALQSQLTAVNNNVSALNTQAGDQVTTLQASPQYSSLGTLFGAAAQSGTAATQGNTAYGLGLAAYNTGNTVGAANPTTANSGSVR